MSVESQAVAIAAGAALRRMREAAGLTQGELAVRIYRDRSYHSLIARVEAGHHLPSLRVAARYAAACGCSLRPVLEAADKALERFAWRPTRGGMAP